MKPLGNIQHYFAQIYIPKEWAKSPAKEGSTMDGGARDSKRTVDLLEDGRDQLGQSEKSRRLLVEENTETCTETNSRTLCPVILGAKSRIWEGLTRGRRLGENENGLELMPRLRMKVEYFPLIGPRDETILDK